MRVRMTTTDDGLLLRSYGKNRRDKQCYARCIVDLGSHSTEHASMLAALEQLQADSDVAFMKAHLGRRYTSLGKE